MNLLKALGRPADAVASFDATLGLAGSVTGASSNDTPGKAVLAAACYDAGSRIAWQLRRFADSEPLARKAVALYEELLLGSPENEDHGLGLSWSLQLLADILRTLGNPIEAEPLNDRALEVAEKFAAKPDASPGHRNGLAWALSRTAWNDRNARRDVSALQRASRAADLWLGLLAKAPRDDNYPSNVLSVCRICVAVLAISPQGTLPEGDLERALTTLRKATEVLKDNAEVCQCVGAASYRAGQWQEAAAACEKAISLNPTADATTLLFLAMAHWQLGEKVAAHKDYEEAVQLPSPKQLRDDEWAQLRNEAAILLGVSPAPKSIALLMSVIASPGLPTPKYAATRFT